MLCGRPNGRVPPPVVTQDKKEPPKRKARDNTVILRPVHPNAGIGAAYRRKMQRLVDEMHKSVLYWLRAAYRQNKPEAAQDESPAAAMRTAIKRLVRRWQKKFDQAAGELADYFATEAAERSDAALKSILKRGGFTVEFKKTRAANDVIQATIGQNVALIKSIPQTYLKNVETLVMQSVQAGRDIGQLTKALQEQHGVTKRRAAFIAEHQNSMATAAMTRARQVELGITEAVWVHSGGSKHPRHSHVQAGREKARYKIAQGWFDPHENKYILPGELPRCKCVSKSVINGFT